MKYKEKIEEAIRKHIAIDINKLLKCAQCQKEIPLDSEDYFVLPNGMPFCSIECAFLGIDKHPLCCGCQLCGSPEEIEKEYHKIEPKFRKVHGMTGFGSALREAQERVRIRKLKEFENNYKK